MLKAENLRLRDDSFKATKVIFGRYKSLFLTKADMTLYDVKLFSKFGYSKITFCISRFYPQFFFSLETFFFPALYLDICEGPLIEIKDQKTKFGFIMNILGEFILIIMRKNHARFKMLCQKTGN